MRTTFPGGAARHRRQRTAWQPAGRYTGPVTKLAAVMIAGLLMLTCLGVVMTATAATVYEIEGKWRASTPATVAKGDSVVSEWRFNLNDDDPAPGNVTIPNTTVTFTVTSGIFTALPPICLTTGVTPLSSISANGTTMTCNLGDRDEGTAELVITGIQVTGNTGDKVSVSGSVGNATATTSQLNVLNRFAMDMKWDKGNPSSTLSDAYQMLAFPWSLRHAPGAAAGPNTVTYDITIAPGNNETVVARPIVDGGACTNITTGQAEHPYSGNNGNANSNRAPFPTLCTFTKVNNTTYRLVLTGIDYSKTMVPTKDTAGTDLPTDWDVVASGMIWFRLTYVAQGTFSITANAPSYVPAGGGAAVADDTSNNANSVAYTRGSWSGGWRLADQNPPVQGVLWTDTYRQMAGEQALSSSSIRPPQGTETSTQTCTVIDTRYVSFEWARAGTISGGVVTQYGGTQPTIEYYTGNGAGDVLNPDNPTAYNPNGWQCNTQTTGWSTTPPANLATVKAVRMTVPNGAQVPSNLASVYTMTRIKASANVGQDIYTWTSYRIGTGAGTWYHPHRTMNVADRPNSGVLTGAGTRYPYTGGGRDLLRVIGARPVIDKSVASGESVPGATVGYTIRYRAESSANTILPTYTLVDVLPLGTTYVPGSASSAPSTVQTLGDGRVQLTWNLTQVGTNADYFMTYDIRLPDDADPGDTFVNDAMATVQGQSASDAATLRIREGGSVFITKTAAADLVPHDANGVATGGWTVRLTSQDTAKQTYTDTIDVLPYNGDGRGTDFSGSYQLAGPVDVSVMPGATVYYSTAAPGTLSDNPKDPSNGGTPGSVAGNTVGWSTTYTPSATAVRVMGSDLMPSATHAFTVNIVTAGASYQDVYVNRAQAMASRTDLRIRSSDRFEIAAAKSVLIKKYVQDAEGTWRDAENIDDYPSFFQNATLNYRLVVTNTGDVTLTDLAITDDKVDLATLSPAPAGLGTGAIISELLPGAANAVTIEYTAPLVGTPLGGSLVNTACATPGDADVEASCDPAGVTPLPSSVAWTKIAAGTTARLSGSEWKLTRVDSGNQPIGTDKTVTDCIEAAAADCTEADRDHRSGEFKVTGLEAGRYRLVEAKAPAGYLLDESPRYIDVSGDTVIQQPIENDQQSGLSIPFTGGRSTTAFTLGSLTLAALVGLLLWVRRRRNEGELVLMQAHEGSAE